MEPPAAGAVTCSLTQHPPEARPGLYVCMCGQRCGMTVTQL